MYVHLPIRHYFQKVVLVESVFVLYLRYHHLTGYQIVVHTVLTSYRFCQNHLEKII